MKIGILYICTGKYSLFWRNFYLSCEKNFISEAEKHYFVFTDAEQLECDGPRVFKIHQENMGWPNNTLMRYSVFLKIEDHLKQMDYIFFFNANALFVNGVSADEFLPTQDQMYVAATHPGFYNKPSSSLPVEKNPESTAFINPNDSRAYYQGAINGGVAQPFINAMKIMRARIDEDLNKGLVAIWHDESHWNKFIHENRLKFKILSPSYIYPEGWNLPFPKIIITRDKNKYGGHKFMRGIQDKKIVTLLKKLFKK